MYFIEGKQKRVPFNVHFDSVQMCYKLKIMVRIENSAFEGYKGKGRHYS